MMKRSPLDRIDASIVNAQLIARRHVNHVGEYACHRLALKLIRDLNAERLRIVKRLAKQQEKTKIGASRQ